MFFFTKHISLELHLINICMSMDKDNTLGFPPQFCIESLFLVGQWHPTMNNTQLKNDISNHKLLVPDLHCWYLCFGYRDLSLDLVANPALVCLYDLILGYLLRSTSQWCSISPATTSTLAPTMVPKLACCNNIINKIIKYNEATTYRRHGSLLKKQYKTPSLSLQYDFCELKFGLGSVLQELKC